MDISIMLDDKNNGSIVRSSQDLLAKSASDLVRRGLGELSKANSDPDIVRSNRTKGRILVVDDEEAIVEVFSAILESEGYEVRATVNSIEALEIAETFRPDVVFTGLIMPRLDGIKLNAELVKIDPQLKIIFISEVETSDLVPLREINPSCDILPSPFERKELSEKTRFWMRETGRLRSPRVMVFSTEEAINETLVERFKELGCAAIGSEKLRKAGWRPDMVIKEIEMFNPQFVLLYRIWPQLTGEDTTKLLFERLPKTIFILGEVNTRFDSELNDPLRRYAESIGVNIRRIPIPFAPDDLREAIGISITPKD